VTAYDRHVGRYAPTLAAGLIRLADVRAGQRVLDVGCGPGALTAALAGVLEAPNVAAIDPSEAFVAACRERVPGADVRQGVGEDLPYADGEFDAALAQLVLPLMPDPAAGLREMRRVVRPGGVVAACAWDDAGMPYLQAVWDAAEAVAPERTAELTVKSARVGYERERLPELFETAGLEDLRTGVLVASAAYEGFDDLWAPLLAGAGESGRLVASLDPQRADAVRDAAWHNLGEPSGRFALTARAWAARGQRPT
jgi:ubiquinone/menaquinone biosynthesis C-methylase UbiE